MAISKALSAFAGIARAGKAIVEKEQEETADITKLGLKQTLANIATAKKNHTEGMQEFREKMEGVRALQRWQYKDPATGNSVPVTRGQAIALIQATGGTKEALQALQDAEIAFKGEGEVGPIQYTTAGALDQETVEAFTEEDDTVGVAPLSLAKGRGARAMANVQKVVDKLGLPKDGYKTPVGLPEVSGVKILSTKTADGDEIKAIGGALLFYKFDDNGNPTGHTPGFLGQDRKGYVFDASTGGNRAIKPDEFDGYEDMPSKRQEETPDSLVQIQQKYIDDNFNKPGYQDTLKGYQNMQAGIQKLGVAYNSMADYALDDSVYSWTANTVGSIVNRAKVEIAGVKILGFGDPDNKPNSSQSIKKLDSFILDNEGASDVATRAKVLDAMIARHAYAYLQANNDNVRPSDADMKRAMEQFSASNAREFYQKSKNFWEETTQNAKNQREALLNHSAFTSYTVMAYSTEQRKAIEQIIEDRKAGITAMAVDTPAFFSREPEEVIKEKTVNPGTAIEVNAEITSKDNTKATQKFYFFIDENGEGKYYEKIGPDGQPEGKGVTAQELKQYTSGKGGTIKLIPQ